MTAQSARIWPHRTLLGVFRLLDGRYKRVLLAMMSGGAARLVSSVVAIISLPLAVRYLGAERYGVWATVTSLVAWLNLLDLGIANSLTNVISRAYARGDRAAARHAFVSAFLVTSAASAVAGCGFMVLWRGLDWARLFQVAPDLSGEARWTALIAALLVLCGLPINLAGKVLAGYQQLHRWNQFVAAGAALSLAGLGLGAWSGVSMPLLFALSFGSNTAVGCAALMWLAFSKPWLIPQRPTRIREQARDLLSAGWSFFLIQIAAAVVFSSDNLVVSHYLGAAEVTPYSVTWRLVGFGAVVQSLVFPALWPAYAEAHARGDVAWIRRTYSMTLKGTLALTGGFALCLAVFGQSVVRLWAGAAAVPTRTLLLAMAGWSVLSGGMTVQSCLLAALNRTRAQAVLSIVAAALNVAVSIALVTRIGSLGVILGTILSYIIVLLVPQTVIVTRALRELTGNAATRTVSAAALPESAW
jgi:O-antigen/teichoic acid export membrane protein